MNAVVSFNTNYKYLFYKSYRVFEFIDFIRILLFISLIIILYKHKFQNKLKVDKIIKRMRRTVNVTFLYAIYFSKNTEFTEKIY